ncbi:MAG: purine-nucleoside phosphorylase [Clostridia bacterium]|nr:purine-nucleoside phosphorylase [Clostridia bacterium]
MIVPAIPTPHIEAEKDAVAKTVLMPGDPKRAEFIAKTFLTAPVLINDIRGVHGYTGTYQGAPVSVMASGMGMPSMGIYSYELYAAYDVRNIIRVGTAGGLCERVRLRELVIAQGACTDSNYASQYHLNGTFAPIADYGLLSKAVAVAENHQFKYCVGNVLSTDMFYTDNDGRLDSETSVNMWGKMGVLAVEMEAAALYMNAARFGRRALAVCTISDHLMTGEALDALSRERTFTDMMTLALETAAAVNHDA